MGGSQGQSSGFSDGEAFTTSLREVLPRLRVALDDADWETTRRLAHRLRGSAGMYGFQSVSAAATALQAALGPAKGGKPVKGWVEVTESGMHLVRACERELAATGSPHGRQMER